MSGKKKRKKRKLRLPAKLQSSATKLFETTNYEVGDTLKIRLPNNYKVEDYQNFKAREQIMFGVRSNRLMTCDEVKGKPNLKLIKKKIKFLATVIYDLLDDTDLNYMERFFARTAYMHLIVLRNSLHRYLSRRRI